MFSNLLLGVQHSPQRKLCIGLAVLVVLMGIVIIPVQGWRYGVPFLLIGLVSVAVLARAFAAHDTKVATAEQLGRVAGEYDQVALRDVVEHVPHDVNPELNRVTGQFSAEEIQATVEQVRGADGSAAGR